MEKAIAWLILAAIVLATYLLVDHITKIKRLKQAEQEWKEFCQKNHFVSQEDKAEHYLDFCESIKAAHGWEYCYFPKI